MAIAQNKTTLIGLALCLLISSCGDSASSEDYPAPDAETYLSTANYESPSKAPGSIQESGAPIAEGRKLIRNGELSLRSPDLIETAARIREAVESAGGYIGEEERTDTDYAKSLRLQVRIPAAAYDELVTRISSSGSEVEYFRSGVRDVTEEYIDLEARLNSKRQLEERYLSLLKSSRSVEDILAIEKELNANRSDIESMQGRLRYLSKQVAYSTLEIRCHQQVDSPGPSFGSQLTDNLGKGWGYFTSFLLGIAAAWPFVLIFTALLSWIFYRRSRARNSI